MFKADVCINYNGTVNKKCIAGVFYGDVASKKVTFGTLPCFAKNGICGNCTEYRLPSEQEIAAQEQEIESYMNAIRTVRPKIKEHIKERGMEGRNVSGFIQCPLCKDGKVTYSCAGAYNGHISAKCSNGCVNWIE